MLGKNLSNRIKHCLFSIIAKRATLLSFFYGYRKSYASLVANKNTDIVIEGFPRSANTYAVLAFEQAQTTKQVIAHHLHAEAQLLLAIKHNIPAIILIREPIDAISSLLIRDNSYTATVALQRYITFYSMIKSHCDYVVLADFSLVTTNFSEVIKQCNNKFSKNFSTNVTTKENQKAIFEQIKKINKVKEQGDSSMIALPNQERRQKNLKRQNKLSNDPLLGTATSIYKELLKFT